MVIEVEALLPAGRGAGRGTGKGADSHEGFLQLLPWQVEPGQPWARGCGRRWQRDGRDLLGFSPPLRALPDG